MSNKKKAKNPVEPTAANEIRAAASEAFNEPVPEPVAREVLDVSTSKRRFAFDSWLALQGSRVYELPLMGKVYALAPEVPLKLQMEINEYLQDHNGMVPIPVVQRYFDAALGEGVYEELVENGMGSLTQGSAFEFMRLVYAGVDVDDLFTKVEDDETETPVEGPEGDGDGLGEA